MTPGFSQRWKGEILGGSFLGRVWDFLVDGHSLGYVDEEKDAVVDSGVVAQTASVNVQVCF